MSIAEQSKVAGLAKAEAAATAEAKARPAVESAAVLLASSFLSEAERARVAALCVQPEPSALAACFASAGERAKVRPRQSQSQQQ